MQLTDKLIREMMPNAGARLTPHLPYIVPAMNYGRGIMIEEPADIACFMAQVGHESAEYRYTREIASGENYDITVNPALALELGNTQPGDGRRFPGRGAIQNTGRGVARACGKFFNQPFEEHPELMERPEWATHVSTWFWCIYKRGLQAVSKRGWLRISTRLVNGGFNGWPDRLSHYQHNLELLGLPPYEGQLMEDVEVRKFQRDHGLEADGIVGQKTLAKL